MYDPTGEPENQSANDCSGDDTKVIVSRTMSTPTTKGFIDNGGLSARIGFKRPRQSVSREDLGFPKFLLSNSRGSQLRASKRARHNYHSNHQKNKNKNKNKKNKNKKKKKKKKNKNKKNKKKKNKKKKLQKGGQNRAVKKKAAKGATTHHPNTSLDYPPDFGRGSHRISPLSGLVTIGGGGLDDHVVEEAMDTEVSRRALLRELRDILPDTNTMGLPLNIIQALLMSDCSPQNDSGLDSVEKKNRNSSSSSSSNHPGTTVAKVSPSGVPHSVAHHRQSDSLSASSSSPPPPPPPPILKPPPSKPWLDVCQDLDELRGRITPVSAPLSAVGITAMGTTDPRGPDPVDAVPIDDPPPPLDRVLCRVQNWVVRLEFVLDRNSARRAVVQARKDMIERANLRRWARQKGRFMAIPKYHPTAADYDQWYVEKLRARAGGAFGRDQAIHDWDCVSDGTRGQGIPIWDRQVPRVRDLERRLQLGIQHNASHGHASSDWWQPRPPTDWCDSIGLVRRSALELYNLVYKMMPEGGRYDINNFAALKRSTTNPKAACLIYASARTVCTGAKTPHEVAWTLRKLETAILRAGGLPMRVERTTFRVSNVVASALLPYYVDMNKLARQCGLFCTYTPEAFPGATLRLPQLGKMAILVYTTKLIIAGSKTKRMLHKALRMAVRVTWQARHIDMASDGARTMLQSQERILTELLNDPMQTRLADGTTITTWGAAIGVNKRSTLTNVV